MKTLGYMAASLLFDRDADLDFQPIRGNTRLEVIKELIMKKRCRGWKGKSGFFFDPGVTLFSSESHGPKIIDQWT